MDFYGRRKRFADCNSAKTGNRKRKANILQRLVRKYGNSFWVCCSRCTHKLGKIAAVDEYMSKSAFEFQVKCTSCKAINVVNAKIPVELPVASEKCAADDNDDCDAFKDNQEITTL